MKTLLTLCAVMLFVLLATVVGCPQQPIPTPPAMQTPVPTPTPAPTPAPSPPAPEPAPPPPPSVKPSEPEKPPDIMNWLASDVPQAHDAMLALISKYPLHTKDDTVTHWFVAGGGVGFSWRFSIPADYLSKAKEHIDNAYRLAKDRKLATELTPRDVSEEEIALELKKAWESLDRQVSQSLSHQKWLIERIKEDDDPTMNRESTFSELIEVYDRYRKDVSNVIAELEFILSYCQEEVKPPSSA